ncbi:MAG: hypothetical protein AAGA66_04260 [Bacteroidota bacterium]
MTTRNSYFLFFFMAVAAFLKTSCSGDDEPGPPPSLPPSFSANVRMDKTHEFFSEAGNGIHTQATIRLSQSFEIIDHGFVYRNGESVSTLSLDTHPAIRLGAPVTDDAFGDLTFEADLVKEWEGPILWVKAFLQTKDTLIYSSGTGIIQSPKLEVTTINRSIGPVGGRIVIGTNRPVTSKDAFFSANGYGGNATGPSYALRVLINEKEVAVEEIKNQRSLVVSMPGLPEAGGTLTVQVGGVALPSPSLTVRNSAYGLDPLTFLSVPDASERQAFRIGSDLYVGGGRNDAGPVSGFVRYHLTDQRTTSIASMPDGSDTDGYSFSLAGKGYVGHPNNMHRYDPMQGAWEKVPLPTTALQYDFTFGSATPVVFEGHVYFTHFDPEVEIGVYYHNFHTFDPETDRYRPLPGYPNGGPNYSKQQGGTVYNGQLHFFPGQAHWVYELDTRDWKELNAAPDSEDFSEVFVHDDQLFMLTRQSETLPGGSIFNRRHKLSLYVYDALTDAWKADVELSEGITHGTEIHAFTSDTGDTFLLLSWFDKVQLLKLIASE